MIKQFLKNYLHIVATTFSILLLSLGFYYILLNAFHMASVNKKVFVNTNNAKFMSYKNNLYNIKKNMENYNANKKFSNNIEITEKINSSLNVCYKIMTNESGILNFDKKYLNYYDVLNINKYFTNKLIDDCYIKNLSWLVNNEKIFASLSLKMPIYQNINYILSDNANYINDELRDNSSYYYNTSISNAMIRNNLNSSYQFVVSNYNDFSKIILGISEYLRGNENE